MSKCCSKHRREADRIFDFASCDRLAHCLRLRDVPATSSSLTNPAPLDWTSRQTLTLLEIRTGTPQPSASATDMPKFSACDGKTRASAPRRAAHFLSE